MVNGEVHMGAYDSISMARREFGGYFEFYNRRRRHQSLDYQTPDKVYWPTLDHVPEAA